MLLTEILITEMSLDDARELIKKYAPEFPFNRVTPEAISQTRRKLALFLHPDRRHGSEEQMKLVNDALDTLEKGGSSFYSHSPYTYTRPQPQQSTPKPKRGSYPFERAPNLSPWMWAGYSGGMPPTETGRGMYEHLKKTAWELAGKPKPAKRHEFHFWGFGGGSHTGGQHSITLFASHNKNALREIAKEFIKWSGTRMIAVIITHSTNDPIVIPLFHNYPTRTSQWFTQETFQRKGHVVNDRKFWEAVTGRIEENPPRPWEEPDSGRD